MSKLSKILQYHHKKVSLGVFSRIFNNSNRIHFPSSDKQNPVPSRRNPYFQSNSSLTTRLFFVIRTFLKPISFIGDTGYSNRKLNSLVLYHLQSELPWIQCPFSWLFSKISQMLKNFMFIKILHVFDVFCFSIQIQIFSKRHVQISPH